MSQKSAKRQRISEEARRRREAQVSKVKDNGAPEVATPPTAIKIPANLAQAVLDYLQTKPFNEVNQLIGGLMRCEKLKE